MLCFNSWPRLSVLAACLIASTQALATCNDDAAPGSCENYFPGPPVQFTSQIPGVNLGFSATQNASGQWDYVYAFQRTGFESPAPFYAQLILPYYSDAGITNLSALPDTQNIVGVAASPWLSSPESIFTSWTGGLVRLPRTPVTVTFTSPYAPTAMGVATLSVKGSSFSTPGMEVTLVGVASADFTQFVALPGSPLAMAASVPEPGSYLLALSGLGVVAGVAGLKRRRLAA